MWPYTQCNARNVQFICALLRSRDCVVCHSRVAATIFLSVHCKFNCNICLVNCFDFIFCANKRDNSISAIEFADANFLSIPFRCNCHAIVTECARISKTHGGYIKISFNDDDDLRTRFDVLALSLSSIFVRSFPWALACGFVMLTFVSSNVMKWTKLNKMSFQMQTNMKSHKAHARDLIRSGRIVSLFFQSLL